VRHPEFAGEQLGLRSLARAGRAEHDEDHRVLPLQPGAPPGASRVHGLAPVMRRGDRGCGAPAGR
jgi:hypothetical protein